ncbi:MAG: hypothetical protein MI702_14210 [Chlorobiales bacterium]|nr:hypothetical protein [Chlorobiales bacterium]
MKLYRLWDSRRPRRIGLISIWTGFLTLLITVLIFGVFYVVERVPREVNFYVMPDDHDDFKEFIAQFIQYIPIEYLEDYQFSMFTNNMRLVESGIEVHGVGSYPEHNEGWTLRYFGDKASNEEHANILFGLVKSSMQEHFREHELLSEFYKQGRIEYSVEDYNLWAREKKKKKKYPDFVYEVWLGYSY